MSIRIITISREFGSGGRSIGKALAQRLGWKYYDKELVKEVALESGFDAGYVEEHGENAPAASPFAYAFTQPGVPGVMRGMSATDFLWCIQREVILKLADREPCVIVGRNADYLLRDRD
ncbi:MAG: AAA family ATPase, partial [Candidatus Spyradocola sp.]